MPPSNVNVVFWMFGFQERRVRFLAWLTLFPNEGFLPQIWHFAILNLLGSDRAVLRDLPNTLIEEYTIFKLD
jgi:hypothetical protein